MTVGSEYETLDASLTYPRFLIYGDSITEYCYDQFPLETEKVNFSFGSALTNEYTRKLDVLQRGFSGYNSEFSRIILPKILAIEHDSRPPECQIKIMTLFLGSNDAAHAGPERVELGRFKENMKFLIEFVLSKGIKLILIGPLWHNTEWYNKMYPEDFEQGIYRTTANNLIYSDTISELAKTYNVPYICLYDEMAKYAETGDYNQLLYDGIHFSGEGYKLLFECLMNTIETHYPKLHPQNITMKLPTWGNPDILKILDSI